MKVANFQLRYWDKKFRGLNICAKTLLFGILTLDRLFLKRYAAIFLILIFLPDMGRHFSTLKVLKWGKRSNYQKFPYDF